MLRIPVPEYQRQQAPSGQARVAQAATIGQGGVMDAAASLQREAAQRERVADQQLANFQRLEHEQKKARNVERVSAARLQWTETLAKRQSEAEASADGFSRGVLTDFDTWRKQSAEAIPDEDERRMFDGMVANIRDHVGLTAMQFEATHRRAYRKRVVMDGIDVDARVAGADPGQMSDVLAQRLAAIKSVGDFSGEERAELEQQARENIAFQAAATLAGQDPVAWLKRKPKDDPVASLLDPEKLRQLNNHARSIIERDKAQREGDNDRAMRAAEKEVEALREFVLDGGLVSPEYESRLQAATGPLWAQAQEIVKVSRSGAAFGVRPIAEQDAILAASKPGDPEQAKMVEHLRTVNGRQKAAYAANPWEAATRFGRAPAAPPYKITTAEQVPEIIAERLKGIGTVEQMAGGPVSPLQPDEATDAALALMAASVDKRAEVLAQVGARLTVPQIAKLADQLDKGDRATALMLKLGADRTDAGRATSVLVGRGAQALKDKVVKRDETALTGWRSEIAAMVRGAGLGERAEQDAIDAAYFVRAALDAPGYEFGAKTNEKAVELVVGLPYERGGMKTLLPRGLKEDEFIERAGKAVAAAGETFYVRGQPLTRAAVLRNLASMGMARDGQRRFTPFYNGAPVTIDPEGAKPLALQVVQ